MRRLLLLIVVAVVGGTWWWNRPDVIETPDGSDRIEMIVRMTEGASESSRLPMVIALHGNGDTPADFFETLLSSLGTPARVILLEGPLPYSGGRFGGRAWPLDAPGVIRSSDSIASVVPSLLERYPTVGRPLVLGFSGGAVVAYGLAARHPELFSSVFPLSGKLPAGVSPAAPSFEHRALLVHAFHGTRDQVIGYSAGKSAVAELQRLAVTAELESLEGGHLEVFHGGKARLYSSLSARLDALSVPVP